MAEVAGACDRLRAVILTSATTIGGLTPLMFEYSLQAPFLIPMVLAVIFGLLTAMVPVLFVVLAIEGDLARITRRGRMHGPAAEQAPPV